MTEFQFWLFLGGQLLFLLAIMGGCGAFLVRVGRWVGEVTTALADTRQDMLELKMDHNSYREESRASFREVHRRVDKLYTSKPHNPGGVL